jgi:CO/xanthine dehydrogenase FAD-binding subunit
MRPFEYFAVKDSKQAVALLAEHGTGAKVLAGGTDLLVELKETRRPPVVVVDISRVADLKGIALTD